ncbi:MAG: VCBS repeat-containing protein [Chitinophagaceae bacterium]|nr:VCBS repeat-containing protein [Chitinophagaceae bacterium]
MHSGRLWLCFSLAVCLAGFLFSSCEEKQKGPFAFEVLHSDRTGIDFSNTLQSTDSFNLFKYMYFYNGAGVGVGDFNNDGLQDIFFASNQSQNSIFLNKGNMQFRNVTKEAGIPSDDAWSTGVSVVDINNDGLLDIYVSRVGKYRILNSHNQFLVCQGINKDGVPQYVDKSEELGLNFSGFGTQAAFFDYDMDGDLDAFLLNHSIHEAGNFRARKEFAGTSHPTSGCRIFRNDSLKFTDVTATSGVTHTAIGYGLGIAVSDINSDGYPDVYIGNDFHENDYLYINQRNGTFKDLSDSCLMHTSRYTMGVDVADANNDGLPDIVSVDMLPADPYILKRSPGEDSYDVFNLKISYGYNYQYTRNALQYNRGDGHFSETGLYSGIAATDWSWAPLWFDFDNDGLKDLFISNGIPKRLNDIDYINYISDQSIQQQIKDNKLNEKDRTLIDKFPQIKIPNKFYHNKGEMKFEDLHDSVVNAPSYSNGAAYADFDNDGDLDVVVNNIDDMAVIYRNRSNDAQAKKHVDIVLNGSSTNRNAIGAKVLLYSGGNIMRYEKFPVRGFLSSMETPLHIGTHGARVDSAVLIWPDNTFQKLDFAGGETVKVNYETGLPQYKYSASLNAGNFTASDITNETGIDFFHKENPFPEFDREPLIPHMISTEGPALAIADIDGNNLEDVFIGASKGNKRGLYLQQRDGKFIRMPLPAFQADSNYEDVEALWADVNNDSFPDLVVASGGNEYYGKDYHLLPRVYLNNGKGGLTRKPDAISGIFETTGCVAANDINGDGFIDLFIGGRGIPWQYGSKTSSYLLINDGTGKFLDKTDQYCPDIKQAGFVTDAVWTDMNNDKKADLLICSEWGTIDSYINTNGRYVKTTLCAEKGWWNFVLPVDVNGDGNIDIVAGNVGLNSRLKASEREPVRLYYNDFDDNGKKEQVLTYYLGGKEIPFSSKAEMEKQLPVLRKRFNYAKEFARASLEDIVSVDKLSDADHFSADYFANCVLVNKGNMKFEVQLLPWETQLTSFRDAVVIDANNDKYPDLLMVGNYYENNIEMGRYDADYGSLLINKGGQGFEYRKLNGVALKGQSRRVQRLMIGRVEAYVVARNDDSTMVIRFNKPKSQ